MRVSTGPYWPPTPTSHVREAGGSEGRNTPPLANAGPSAIGGATADAVTTAGSRFTPNAPH